LLHDRAVREFEEGLDVLSLSIEVKPLRSR